MSRIVVVAVAASLTYQYALQGSLKEIGLLATIAATAAVAQEALATDRPYAGAGLVAVCFIEHPALPSRRMKLNA